MYKDARIFVAGHRGLVGAAVRRRLERAGYRKLIFRTHAELDLTRQQAVEDFFDQERPEYVFLCAARVGGIMANRTYPADFIYINTLIAANVIHASFTHGVKKLLNLGSSCIYPRLASQPLKEAALLTGALEPTNEPYAVAKIAAIKLCSAYNRQYGTNFLSVMPTNLYGPQDNFDLATSHVLPALMRKMHLAKCLEQGDWRLLRADLDARPLAGVTGAAAPEAILDILARHGIASNTPEGTTPLKNRTPEGNSASPSQAEYASGGVRLTLWGTGSPRREFLHADDLADACVHLMQTCEAQDLGEFVNIGAGQDQTIADLARIVAAVVGYRGAIAWDATRPDGTPRKLLDISRMRSLGWEATTDLPAGIEKTYRWYIEQNMQP